MRDDAKSFVERTIAAALVTAGDGQAFDRHFDVGEDDRDGLTIDGIGDQRDGGDCVAPDAEKPGGVVGDPNPLWYGNDTAIVG